MSKSRVPLLDVIDLRIYLLGTSFLALVAFGVAVGASAWDEFQASRKVSRALLAFHEGFHREALSLCVSAAGIREGYPDPKFLAIAIRTRTGGFESPAAMREAVAALSREAPAGRSIWVETGLLAAELRMGSLTEEIRSRLEDLRRRHPCLETSMNLAAFHARRDREGDLDRAGELLDEALASRGKEPPSADALIQANLGLAAIRERQGNFESARRSLDRVAWTVGRRFSEGQVADRPIRGIDLRVRLERLELLDRFSPWRIDSGTVSSADGSLAVARDRPDADGRSAGRLANLIAVRILQAPRQRPLADEELARAASLLNEGVRFSEGDPVPRLNRIAFLLAGGESLAAVRVQDPKPVLEEYRLLHEPLEGIPPAVALAAAHNRAVLSRLSGAEATESIWALKKLVAAGAAHHVIFRNIGVMHDSKGERLEAAAAYRKSLEILSEQPGLRARLEAIEGSGGGGGQ